MLCILHGWLLEGSGSNLWTRSVVRSLCRRGETVHLVCQENHPERYDFISTSVVHRLNGKNELTLERDVPYEGRCILHRPELGETLPVFVWDKYEEYSRVVPMIDLSTGEIESYVARNLEVVTGIVREMGVSVIHANHAVMMPVVAQRVEKELGVPFTVMPHGSDIEYAVKKDDRFLDYASSAFVEAKRIFVIGDEMRARVLKVFAGVPALEQKLVDLHLGVDTEEFEPVTRDERKKEIEALTASLATLPRGKTREQEIRFAASLDQLHDASSLPEILKRSSGYDAKLPDEIVESKIAGIPWATVPTLLFVGRLIAWKGIQSLVAALPFGLARHPDARILIVGHGPLREAMEAFVWALRKGRRDVVETLVARGRMIDGSADKESDTALTDVSDYLDKLRQTGRLDDYFETARRVIRPETVTFTGYLTHNELKHLFPCCDVGVFPSVVREAGPLVFLEALASGCLPLGTYFGGMRASIDAIATVLPRDVAEIMKLDPRNTVEELAEKIPLALDSASRYRSVLSRFARENYDWSSVSVRFLEEIGAIEARAGAISSPASRAVADRSLRDHPPADSTGGSGQGLHRTS